MNTIQVKAIEERFKKHETRVKNRAVSILKILKKKNAAVDIFLAGNSFTRKLNKTFRDKSKPANVLSFQETPLFPHPENPRNTVFLGEIYLNPEMVQEWGAKGGRVEKGKAQPASWRVFSADELLVHGFLHLLDYDHIKKNDRIRMEKKEKEILNKLKSSKF